MVSFRETRNLHGGNQNFKRYSIYDGGCKKSIQIFSVFEQVAKNICTFWNHFFETVSSSVVGLFIYWYNLKVQFDFSECIRVKYKLCLLIENFVNMK